MTEMAGCGMRDANISREGEFAHFDRRGAG